MEPFADTDDVIAVWGPLSVKEEAIVDGLLAQASTKLRLRGRNLGVDVDALFTSGDQIIHEAIKDAVVNAVRRVLLNPEAMRSLTETTGPFSRSQTIDAAVSSGFIYIADEDLTSIFPPVKGLIRSFRIRSGY